MLKQCCNHSKQCRNNVACNAVLRSLRIMSCNITLRVYSYELGFRDLALLASKSFVKFSMCWYKRVGWLGFRDLALLASKSFVKFSMCWYKRVGWLGFRGLGFSNRDLGKRAETFVPWALQPGHRDESGIKCGVQMALFCHLCLLYFQHHKHPI